MLYMGIERAVQPVTGPNNIFFAPPETTITVNAQIRTTFSLHHWKPLGTHADMLVGHPVLHLKKKSLLLLHCPTMFICKYERVFCLFCLTASGTSRLYFLFCFFCSRITHPVWCYTKALRTHLNCFSIFPAVYRAVSPSCFLLALNVQLPWSFFSSLSENKNPDWTHGIIK